jgi:hypothetical protein
VILQEELPSGLMVVGIADGAALVRIGDDFEAKLILIPAPPPPDPAVTTAESNPGGHHPASLSPTPPRS